MPDFRLLIHRFGQKFTGSQRTRGLRIVLKLFFYIAIFTLSDLEEFQRHGSVCDLGSPA